MVAPAAEPPPVKSRAWPDTDQPGWLLRVSVTVIAFSAAAAIEPDTAKVTVPGATVRVKDPVGGTVTASGMVPEAVPEPEPDPELVPAACTVRVSRPAEDV